MSCVTDDRHGKLLYLLYSRGSVHSHLLTCPTPAYEYNLAVQLLLLSCLLSDSALPLLLLACFSNVLSAAAEASAFPLLKGD